MTIKNYEQLQSETIDWLRFPLIVCVVFIHNKGYGGALTDVEIMWQHLGANDLYTLLRITLSSILPSIAVPAFFLISGYLFFYKWHSWDNAIYKRKLKSRTRTLLLPYIIWNALAIVSILCGDALYNLALWLFRDVPFSFTTNIDGVTDWFRAFWDINVSDPGEANFMGVAPVSTYPINIPLWYVRDLMVNVILAPLFFWCIRHCGKYYIGLLLAAYLFRFTFNVPGLSITSLLFFNAGGYFSIYGKNMLLEFRRIEKPAYVLAAVFLVISIVLYSQKGIIISISGIYVIFGIISAFCIASRLIVCRHIRINRFIVGSIFFIYAAHNLSIFAYYNQLVLPQVYAIGNRWIFPLTYVTTPFVKIAICLILYRILYLTTPRLLSIMTGRR